MNGVEVECLVLRVCRCLHNKNVQTRCCRRAAGNQCQWRLTSVHDKATTSSSRKQSIKVVRIPDTHHLHSKVGQAPEVSYFDIKFLLFYFISSTISPQLTYRDFLACTLHMPVPPNTTPLPPPIMMLQSSITNGPSAGPGGPTAATSAAPASPNHTSSYLPPTITPLPAGVNHQKGNVKEAGSTEDGKAEFKLPKLRLEMRDLEHPASTFFLESCIASKALVSAVKEVVKALYTDKKNHTKVPGTRSVTLILRSMDGVAYTCGSDLDSDHKEMHLNLGYVASIAPNRRKDEMLGVLTHEMVHCYQYDGKGSCPGGLIEGIADWVRLKAGLAPPHWKKAGEGEWDAGYDRTAYFLEYLEARYGEGTVRRLNEKLRTEEYQTKRFWTELLGRPVEQLWLDYGKSLKPEDL